MANEITMTGRLRVANGSLCNHDSGTRAISITQNTAAPARTGGTQTIGTAAAGEALDIGDLTTNGCAFFRNCNATQFVEIGIQHGGTFYPLVRLNAGESFPCRLAQGITPYARANTADVILEADIYDD
jgi:hypothetical protein